MKNLSVITGTATLLVTLVACGTATGSPEPAARSTSAASSTPTPVPTPTTGLSPSAAHPAADPPPTPANTYGTSCLYVSPALAAHLASRPADGADVVAGRAFGWLPAGSTDVYLIAMQFRVDGTTYLGTWAVTRSLTPGKQGRTYAVDPTAERFTSWPVGDGAGLHVRQLRPNIGNVRGCQLV